MSRHRNDPQMAGPHLLGSDIEVLGWGPTLGISFFLNPLWRYDWHTKSCRYLIYTTSWVWRWVVIGGPITTIYAINIPVTSKCFLLPSLLVVIFLPIGVCISKKFLGDTHAADTHHHILRGIGLEHFSSIWVVSSGLCRKVVGQGWRIQGETTKMGLQSRYFVGLNKRDPYASDEDKDSYHLSTFSLCPKLGI